MSIVTVLLIEDDPILAMDMALRLAQMNYRVLGAVDTGHKALDIYRKYPIDLVLIDMGVPDTWTGIEMATKLQQIRQTPFIYMSTETDKSVIELARRTGPSAYIAKPFNDLPVQIAIKLALQKNNIPYAEQQTLALDETIPLALIEPGETLLNLNDVVFIKQNYRFLKFYLSDILYMQSEGNYTDIFTTTKKYTLRLVLNKVLEKIQSTHIIRTHRSYAVNIRHINSFSEQEVVVGSHTLPVGRSYRDAFIKRFSLLS